MTLDVHPIALVALGGGLMLLFILLLLLASLWALVGKHAVVELAAAWRKQLSASLKRKP